MPRCFQSTRDILTQILLTGILGAGGTALLGHGLVGADAGGVRIGGLRGQAQQEAAHGGQIHGEGIIPTVHTAVSGVEVQLAAALVGTAPLGSLGVQHQLRRAGELEVQRELFVGVVLGVHDAQQVLAPALA